jgi:hypothetical protein
MDQYSINDLNNQVGNLAVAQYKLEKPRLLSLDSLTAVGCVMFCGQENPDGNRVRGKLGWRELSVDLRSITPQHGL